jgi:hypothetical protein
MELDLDPVLLADLIEHGVAMVRERAAVTGSCSRATSSRASAWPRQMSASSSKWS